APLLACVRGIAVALRDLAVEGPGGRAQFSFERRRAGPIEPDVLLDSLEFVAHGHDGAHKRGVLRESQDPTFGVGPAWDLDSPLVRGSTITAMDPTLSIGDFSRMTFVSVKALRHYHEVGLLAPAAVDPGSGYRRYA